MLHPIALELKTGLSNTNNSFNGSFTSNFQDKSIPHKLVALVSLIIDACGVENRAYSQQALTIAQLILTNFHKREKTHSYTSSPCKTWRNASSSICST